MFEDKKERKKGSVARERIGLVFIDFSSLSRLSKPSCLIKLLHLSLILKCWLKYCVIHQHFKPTLTYLLIEQGGNIQIHRI